MSCSRSLRSECILNQWTLRQSWNRGHLSSFSCPSNVVIRIVLDQKNTATSGSSANFKSLRWVRACSFFALTKDIVLVLLVMTGAFSTCALSCCIRVSWTRRYLNLRLFVWIYTRVTIIAAFVEPIWVSEVSLVHTCRLTSRSLEIQRARWASISFDWLWEQCLAFALILPMLSSWTSYRTISSLSDCSFWFICLLKSAWDLVWQGCQPM